MTEVNHAIRAHSSLGASGAYRWMPCPASIRLSAGLPNVSTEAAALGTAVHEIGEKCLSAILAGKNQGRDAVEYLGDEMQVEAFTFIVDDDMVYGAQMYVDVVMADYCPGDGDQLFVETRFSLEHIHPGMFGTGDAMIYKPKTRKLVILDYKNGRVVVDVEDNDQLKYYGIGGLEALGDVPVDEVELVIIQPNAAHKEGPVRRWGTSAYDLIGFMDELKQAALRTEDPDQQPVAGDWCGFCLAAVDCPANRAAVYEACKFDFTEEVYDMEPSQLAAILAEQTLIENRIKAVKAEAFRRADQLGEEIPGYKLVAKRATRKWREDVDVITEIGMRFGVDDDDRLYNKKLKTPAQFEKGLTKDQKSELGELYDKRSSGNKLVPIADPAMAQAPSGRRAVDDFQEEPE